MIDLDKIKTKEDVLRVLKALSEHVGGFHGDDTAWVEEVMTCLDRAGDVIEGKVNDGLV